MLFLFKNCFIFFDFNLKKWMISNMFVNMIVVNIDGIIFLFNIGFIIIWLIDIIIMILVFVIWFIDVLFVIFKIIILVKVNIIFF